MTLVHHFSSFMIVCRLLIAVMANSRKYWLPSGRYKHNRKLFFFPVLLIGTCFYLKEFLFASSGLRARNDTGYFFDSCLRHCQSTDDTWFSSVRVDGQLARETFANWYYGRSGETKVMDCEEYPCNDSCGRPRDALGNDV